MSQTDFEVFWSYARILFTGQQYNGADKEQDSRSRHQQNPRHAGQGNQRLCWNSQRNQHFIYGFKGIKNKEQISRSSIEFSSNFIKYRNKPSGICELLEWTMNSSLYTQSKLFTIVYSLV